MKKGPLAALFLTVFLDLLGFGLVVPFLPGVARDLGASDLGATLLGTAYSLMQFLFIPLWGRLSDRVGRRPVLLISIAATAGSMVLLGFAATLPLLFAARLLGGAATANLAVAQAYIADVTTPETRARGMALIGVAFGVGFVIGPLVGGELGRVVMFGREGPLAAFVAAGLSLVNLVWAFFGLPESLPPKEARTEASAAFKRRRGPIDRESFRILGLVPGLGRAVFATFVMTFFFSGMEITFRLFTADGFSMTVAATGRVFGFVGVVAVLVQGGLIGRLNRKFGEVRLLVVGLILMALGFAVTGSSAIFPIAGFAGLMLGMTGIAVGNSLSVPTLSSYISRQAGREHQGAVLGANQSMSALARALGPVCAGLTYDFWHISAPYFVGAIGFVVLAIVVRGLPPLRVEVKA